MNFQAENGLPAVRRRRAGQDEIDAILVVLAQPWRPVISLIIAPPRSGQASRYACPRGGEATRGLRGHAACSPGSGEGLSTEGQLN